MDSYDVRFWDIKKLGNGTAARYPVRWAVDGREHCKSFKARPLADGFLDGLKEEPDEKHVCPWQMEIVRRLVLMYCNPVNVQPDATVLDWPFATVVSASAIDDFTRRLVRLHPDLDAYLTEVEQNLGTLLDGRRLEQRLGPERPHHGGAAGDEPGSGLVRRPAGRRVRPTPHP